MSTTPDEAWPEPSNRLLAALSSEAYARLLPHTTRVQLGLKDILYKPKEPIRDVYFPLNGVCSMLSLEDFK